MTNEWTKKELDKNYIGKMTATTIPVNITITGEQRILDMSELEVMLKNATVLSQEECYCREKMGHCLEPMDGCIGIDDDAIESIEKDGAKKITVEEAMAAMKRTYDAGLVHLAYVFAGKDKVERICSCCSCCCHSMSAAVRFGYSDHVFSSKFIAKQDQDRCSGCGLCVERCQFSAREMVDDVLVFTAEKCFGCGLCVGTCEAEAIVMCERQG